MWVVAGVVVNIPRGATCRILKKPGGRKYVEQKKGTLPSYYAVHWVLPPLFHFRHSWTEIVAVNFIIRHFPPAFPAGRYIPSLTWKGPYSLIESTFVLFTTSLPTEEYYWQSVFLSVAFTAAAAACRRRFGEVGLCHRRRQSLRRRRRQSPLSTNIHFS